ncbi:GNAT family N-acetyltransferase [Thalassotalea psychrophila]|uniref:GNAT family N-acetyltransferase n=1 Tax=Thalassotalea psychrophila TaxID=3065647 RepID=A0ABY9TWP4_9GAMM|nr:GNAT family N-acetyltransferase [Colwelliaceae bacterium SQ149]
MQFETNNYAMQLLHADDQEFFTGLYQDPTTCKYTGGVFTKEQAFARFEFCLKRNTQNTLLTFTITGKAKGKSKDTCDKHPQGFCMLVWSKTLPTVEVGIMLKSEYIGKGIAKEVLAELLTVAFSKVGIERLMIRTNVNNSAMIKTIERFRYPTDKITTEQINADRISADSKIMYTDDDYYWYIDKPA